VYEIVAADKVVLPGCVAAIKLEGFAVQALPCRGDRISYFGFRLRDLCWTLHLFRGRFRRFLFRISVRVCANQISSKATLAFGFGDKHG